MLHDITAHTHDKISANLALTSTGYLDCTLVKFSSTRVCMSVSVRPTVTVAAGTKTTDKCENPIEALGHLSVLFACTGDTPLWQ